MVKHGLAVPKHLNERQLREIRELAGICDAADGIELKLNWSMLEKRSSKESNDFLWYDNGRLAGFLALYHFNPKEAEVGGMVHPDFRRSGIFSALVEHALDSARKQGVPRLLFVCPRQSVSAQGYLRSQKAAYCYSEFGMKLEDRPAAEPPSPPRQTDAHSIRLRRAGPCDRELLIRLDSQGFEISEEDGVSLVDMIMANPAEEWPYIAYVRDDVPVGRINIHARDRNAHFFGFSILPEHRKKGYGRQILTEAIRLSREEGLRSMSLEVACENREALTLYHSCGFRENYVNDYYALPVMPE